MGYRDEEAILDAIRRELSRETAFVPSDQRTKLLQLSLARYDKLRRAVWPAAMMGDPASVDKAIKIEQAYMKALGTDIPDTQVNQQTVLVIGGQQADYVARLKAIADE